MLARDDLKAIRGIVREEVENESQSIKVELGMKFDLGISQLADGIGKLESRVTKVHRDLKKEIKYIANILDKDIIAARKRVDRIEDHLGLGDN